MRIVCFLERTCTCTPLVRTPKQTSHVTCKALSTSHICLCSVKKYLVVHSLLNIEHSLSALLFLGLLIFTEWGEGSKSRGVVLRHIQQRSVYLDCIVQWKNMRNAGKNKTLTSYFLEFGSQIKNFDWKHISIRPDFLRVSFQLPPKNCGTTNVF